MKKTGISFEEIMNLLADSIGKPPSEKVLARERAMPWTWYCRIDGQEGEYPTREERDVAAEKHRDEECATREAPRIGKAEAGHLLHVWRY